MGSVVYSDLSLDVFELKFITVWGADQIDLVKNTYDVNTKPGNQSRLNQQTFSAHHWKVIDRLYLLCVQALSSVMFYHWFTPTVDTVSLTLMTKACPVWSQILMLAAMYLFSQGSRNSFINTLSKVKWQCLQKSLFSIWHCFWTLTTGWTECGRYVQRGKIMYQKNETNITHWYNQETQTQKLCYTEPRIQEKSFQRIKSEIKCYISELIIKPVPATFL